MQDPIPNRQELIELTPPSILAAVLRPHPDMALARDEVKLLLPELLQHRLPWRSMHIDYQPPHLMRIFCQVGIVRANLHYFLPVDKIEDEAVDPTDINLYHPHPWMAGFEILEGHYQQCFGRASELGVENPPPRGPMAIQDAADPLRNRYAMADPLLWHQVIPFADGKPVTTLMVTYIPPEWPQNIPPPTQRQRTLIADEINFMFDHCAGLLPAPSNPGLIGSLQHLLHLGR